MPGTKLFINLVPKNTTQVHHLLVINSTHCQRSINCKWMKNSKPVFVFSFSINHQHYFPALVIITIVVGLGIHYLSASHAATPTASVELELGSISRPASFQSDSSASGGKYVLFGSATPSTASIAVGVAVDDSNTAKNSQLSNYTTAAGKAPAFVEWYQSWAEPLYYSSQETSVKSANLAPIISWTSDSTPLTSISNGSQNSTIDAAAALAKLWPGTLYIRFDYEMNITSSAWDPANLSETPADYVNAWRYVVNRFKTTDGVTNVKWIWSPNINCNGSCPFDSYYPGSSSVDMVGLDGYNYASLDGVIWQSFGSLFQASYNDLIGLAPGIPVDIAEVGSAEANSAETTSGDSKATWVQQMSSTITANMPKVRAVTWWEGADNQASLEVQSTPAALSAWKSAVISGQNFQGTLP